MNKYEINLMTAVFWKVNQVFFPPIRSTLFSLMDRKHIVLYGLKKDTTTTNNNNNTN